MQIRQTELCPVMVRRAAVLPALPTRGRTETVVYLDRVRGFFFPLETQVITGLRADAASGSDMI